MITIFSLHMEHISFVFPIAASFILKLSHKLRVTYALTSVEHNLHKMQLLLAYTALLLRQTLSLMATL